MSEKNKELKELKEKYNDLLEKYENIKKERDEVFHENMKFGRLHAKLRRETVAKEVLADRVLELCKVISLNDINKIDRDKGLL